MIFLVILQFKIALISILLFNNFIVSGSIGFIATKNHNGYTYRTFPDDSYFFMAVTLKKSNNIARNPELRSLYTNSISFDNIRCGEIVLGLPSCENNDGSISVDIGIPQRLIVPRSSMIYMNERERKQLYELIERYNSPNIQTTRRLDLNELILETINVSKKIPERKRKTYLKPKFSYPNDFLKTKTKDPGPLSYDLGVGGEISPRKIPENKSIDRTFIPDSDKMEFVVTSISPYSNVINGDFFSEAIVESKRRIYLSMVMKSANLSSQFVQFKAIIRDKCDSILKVELLDSKFTHLSGLNAYTLSRQNDNIGDTIDVYLAGADPALEHIYLFRSHGDTLMRSENINKIFNGLIKYYINSGLWFKTQVEGIKEDYLILRILGNDEKKYLGYVTRDQLPYSFSEKLLNETYRRMNRTNEYFNKEDMGIGIGKLNYIFHYDNSIYTRVAEFTVEESPYVQKFSSKKGQMDIFLTCKNICKPNKLMETIYHKIITQNIADLNLKTDLSYPCLLLGNVGEHAYFAINYTFKEKFTLDDDYIVGIMETEQYPEDLPFDIVTHAKISKIETFNLTGGYIVRKEFDNSLKYKEHPLPIWLLHQNKGYERLDFTREKEWISLVFMNVMLLTDVSSPQFNEFLPFQPILPNALFKKYFVPGNQSNYGSVNKFRERNFAPPDLTSSLLGRFNKLQRGKMGSERFIGSRIITERENIPIAFSDVYVHNEEWRNEYIRKVLDKKQFKMYKRIVESSNFNSEILMRELLTDADGQSFWEFLEKLKNPILRRNIEIDEAFFFERTIKNLLSVSRDFFLDDIYNSYDKEDLVFSTIVPKPNKTGFYQVEELEEYFNFIYLDLIMDKTVRSAIHRTLTLLTKPKNTLMSLLRNRHSHIPNDVFFYAKKTVHYSTYEKISRPFKGRYSDISFPTIDEDIEIVSMLPFSTIAKEPGSFGHQLEGYGLHNIRKMYNKLIRAHKPIKSKFADSAGFVGDLVDLTSRIKDLDLENLEFDDSYQIKKDAIDGTKENLRLTYKDWKSLNKYPTTESKEDLKDFIQSLKKYKPVHGIKLPTL